MVNNISKLLINEIIDLDIKYTLTNEEIINIIPLFEYLEKCRTKNIIKIISEKSISKTASNIELQKSTFTGNKIHETIKKNIQEYGSCIEIYHPSGNIEICIFGKTQSEINKYKDIIVQSIIFVLHCCIDNCPLKSINIFLTDLKKKVNKNDLFLNNKTSLNSDQVNTGITYKNLNNSEIFLWRKEEIVKVCIHELIHSLDWDTNKSHNEIFNIFKNEFNINKKILLAEAYTEGWAKILNCYICAYLLENNPKEIFCRFIHYIELETLFSVWQVYKIIQLTNPHKKCSIDSFLNITDHHTNVFPYYFLTAGILFNIADWICLCSNVCENYINFKATKNNNKNMANWFINCITNKSFYELCKKIQKKFNNNDKKNIYDTMRMSIVECI